MLVKKGNLVKSYYTGKFDNGKVFDTSTKGQPARRV